MNEQQNAESVRCVIDVGHRGGAPAEWVSTVSPTLTVCGRHKRQYDERDDLGPFGWAQIDGSERP